MSTHAPSVRRNATHSKNVDPWYVSSIAQIKLLPFAFVSSCPPFERERGSSEDRPARIFHESYDSPGSADVRRTVVNASK